MRKFEGPLHRVTLLVLVILCSLVGPDTMEGAVGKSRDSSISPVKTGQANPSYCGVYCLYAAMKALGFSVDPVNLVKPEYIGSSRGSSLAELRRAAEENGLHALAIGRLTPKSLRSCSLPLLLHVKRGSTSEEYDHYELFLGVEESGVKLLNPPDPVRLVTFHELASRWDGNGLIVSRDPITLRNVFAPARKWFAVCAAATLAGLGLLHFARGWLPNGLSASWERRLGLSAGQGVVLGLATLLFAFGYHFLWDEGFLAQAGATEAVQQAHAGDFIPKVSAKAVGQMLDESAPVLIDARYKRDFEAGHLEGAISVPVNATDAERRATLADVDRGATIIVYCQSAGCPFAKKVAVKLKNDGYANIAIFKGGWHEWTTRKQQEKEANS